MPDNLLSSTGGQFQFPVSEVEVIHQHSVPIGEDGISCKWYQDDNTLVYSDYIPGMSSAF